jgi:hypothetical protein
VERKETEAGAEIYGAQSNATHLKARLFIVHPSIELQLPLNPRSINPSTRTESLPRFDAASVPVLKATWKLRSRVSFSIFCVHEAHENGNFLRTLFSRQKPACLLPPSHPMRQAMALNPPASSSLGQPISMTSALESRPLDQDFPPCTNNARSPCGNSPRFPSLSLFPSHSSRQTMLSTKSMHALAADGSPERREEIFGASEVWQVVTAQRFWKFSPRPCA